MLYDFGSSTIKRYSDNIVVKSGGKQRRESEAAALHFTAQLGLPTPRMHEFIEGNFDEKCQTQIRMSFIEGQTLDSI